MDDVYAVIKLVGRILSVALMFSLIIVGDVKIWSWFDDNRTRKILRGKQNSTYPWVNLVYKLWIFLHMILIGGFFIVCWFVL